MKRKWVKRIGLTIVLAPILTILIAIILLYIPPVQNLLRREATAFASRATGMQISVQRIDLRFPLRLLVRGVEVVQAPDTILTLERMSASVQILPLFRGKAKLDNLTLEKARINSAHLLKGIQLSGELGNFTLRSHGIDWANRLAVIDNVELTDTHLNLSLTDTTTTPKDTTSTPVDWKGKVERLKLSNVSFRMQTPADSMQMAVQVGEATANNADIDLGKNHYDLEKLLLDASSFSYDMGDSAPGRGFDPSHIALRDVHIDMDSTYWHGKEMNATVRQLTANERSGLSILSLSGQFYMDSLRMRVPGLAISTPYSELTLAAQLYRRMAAVANDRLFASLDGHIGWQDVMLFSGQLPTAFQTSYPAHPLTAHIGISGDFDRLDVSTLSLTLPGAFALTGGGYVQNLPDSINRTGQLNLHLRAQRLDFVKTLAGMPADSSFVIPQNMTLTVVAGMRGPQYQATVLAREGDGVLQVAADYNTSTGYYNADFKLDSLNVAHFLPRESIRTVALSGALRGRGTDVRSYRTTATLHTTVDRFEYGKYIVNNIRLDGELRNAIASAKVVSNNRLLKMDAQGEYTLNTPYTRAGIEARVDYLNLYELGFIPDTLKKPLAFDLNANVGKDTINVVLNAGDLRLRLRSRGTIEALISESSEFAAVLNRQIAEKHLDHAELRRALPSAAITLNSGKENPLNYYLALRNIRYNEMRVGFVATPRIGINGRASIHTLKIDTLQLDTVYFFTRQDTSLMRFQGGVINTPGNPHLAFRASLTGEIRSEDAELMLDFVDEQGEKGIQLGVNIRPEQNGMLFAFGPEEPIVAFRRFAFKGHNTVFLQNNLRVLADIEMLDEKGMGLRVKSMEEADSTYLQNLDIELRAIDLAEISKVLPYLPDVSGLFYLEANYKQSPQSLQVSTEGRVDQLHYKENPVGNIGFGVTWLPGNAGQHYLNSYLTSEETEVMTAGGIYDAKKANIDVNAALEHFPLKITNAFIPEQLARLAGDLDGQLAITGHPGKPVLDGELTLDSVAVYSYQYGFRFRMDNRPLKIAGSRMTFDKFAIFTTNDNPFTVDGYVDVADLSQPMVNLSLSARNYELLNTPRRRGSILYGKIMLDINSTLRGPVNNLVMRGNVNVLGNTNVTYVMMDSPLSVQDRLGDLVEFASFSDTLRVQQEEKRLVALGGLDATLSININPSARVNVDLSPDRSSHVELQGGGNLIFQYTPQGQILLTGRYVLTQGTINYSLPVIPLREFNVTNGSYVEWSGDPADPNLNLNATQNMRVAVANDDGNSSRLVSFIISINVRNRLNNMELAFDLSAPEDRTVQDALNAMDAAERSKQAITMMATGIFLAGGSTGGNFNMGTALNSLLQNQIANLAGSALRHANITLGVDNFDGQDGSRRTDYSFSYSQRLFNDRVQVVIGGSISSGNNPGQSDTFIDNVSLEYRLDSSGTRYIRLFHNREYENFLESNITETGGGIVLRKRVNKLGELFIFKRTNPNVTDE